MKALAFLAVMSMVKLVMSIALLSPWSSTTNGASLLRRQITPETSNEFIDGGCRDVIFFFARGTGAPGNMVCCRLLSEQARAEFTHGRKDNDYMYIQCELIVSPGTSTRTTTIRRPQICSGRRNGRHPRSTVLGCYSRQSLPWGLVSQ